MRCHNCPLLVLSGLCALGPAGLPKNFASHLCEPLCSSVLPSRLSGQAYKMSTGGESNLGNQATGPAPAPPLTRADIPELVKAVAEALSERDPSADPRAREGKSSPSEGEFIFHYLSGAYAISS